MIQYIQIQVPADPQPPHTNGGTMPYRMRSLMAFAGLMLVAQSASAQKKATSSVRIPTGCIHQGKDECVSKTETTYVANPTVPAKPDTVIVTKDRPVPQYINVPVEVPRNDRSWRPAVLTGLGLAALGAGVAYFVSRGSVEQNQCVSVGGPPLCKP